MFLGKDGSSTASVGPESDALSLLPILPFAVGDTGCGSYRPKSQGLHLQGQGASRPGLAEMLRGSSKVLECT